MTVPFVLNGNNLSVFLLGKLHSVGKDHLFFKKIVSGLKNGLSETELLGLINRKAEKRAIADAFGVEFKEDDDILIDGSSVSKAIVDRYRFMVNNDFPLEGFKQFVENLAKNPSIESRKDLYGFLEACSLPITEDGCFLAYKRVNKNYTDCQSGKFDNSIGKTVEMPREFVDANRNNTCSTGLHVCSRSYLGHFSGDRIIVVKVNPKDVVSVPTDYQQAKMRVCRYEVIAEVENETAETIPDFAVNTEQQPIVVNEAAKDAASESDSSKNAKNEVSKVDRWNDYIKTRNIPENISELHGKARNAFIKFCGRLRNSDGSEKAGDDVCKAQSLSEIRQIILGF